MTDYRNRLDAGEFDQHKKAPKKEAPKAHPRAPEPATPTPTVGTAAETRTPAAKKTNS